MELPEGWVWVTLDEIMKKIVDGTHHTPTYTTKGIPFISVKDIRNGKIYFDDCKYISLEEHEILCQRCKPELGDLLITKSGTIGRCAVVDTKTPFSLFVSVALLKPASNEISASFISLAFQSWFQTINVQNDVTGSTIKNFHLIDFRRLTLPLPPFNEQKRIVAAIESLRNRSQNARSALAAIPELCDKFRQSVLAAAFRGDLTADWREQNPDVEPASVLLERIRQERRQRWEEAEIQKLQLEGKAIRDSRWKDRYEEPETPNDSYLSELPQNWRWINIDNLAFVVRGASPRPAGNPKYFGGEVPWITVSEITKDENIYLESTSSFVTEEGKQKSRFIEEGTFLLTNSGATLGVPKITKVSGCINDGSVALLFLGEELKIYLYYFLTSLTQSLRAINQGAAQPNLNTTIVRNIMVPLPPLEEQQAVVKQIQTQLSTIGSVESCVLNDLHKIDYLNCSILAKAFRGELVEQDPNDEPASVLLERIRAEREQQTQGKAKKSGKKGQRTIKAE